MNKKILEKIIHFGDLYRKKYLNIPEFDSNFLKSNWWNGLSLFLNHSFYQGRKDEVSKLVEYAANNVLRKYFWGKTTDGLDRIDLRIIDDELHKSIGRGRIGKEGDIKMVIEILKFVKILPERNLTIYSLDKINDGLVREHFDELQSIFQIGPKIASFYLRDLISIYNLDNSIEDRDLEFLQPVDVWVRRVAFVIGIISNEREPVDQVRDKIIKICKELNISSLKFNQGAWYIGKNAFNILTKNLENITIS